MQDLNLLPYYPYLITAPVHLNIQLSIILQWTRKKVNTLSIIFFYPFPPYGTPAKTIEAASSKLCDETTPSSIFTYRFSNYIRCFLGNHIIVNISSRP